MWCLSVVVSGVTCLLSTLSHVSLIALTHVGTVVTLLNPLGRVVRITLLPNVVLSTLSCCHGDIPLGSIHSSMLLIPIKHVLKFRRSAK